MTAGRALVILKLNYPDKTILQYVELKDKFVFLAVPEGQENKQWFDAFFGVRKSDGKIVPVSPFSDMEYLKESKNRVVLWHQGHTQNSAS